MFKLKPEAVDEVESAEMERMWFAFERNFLWPQRARDDSLHPPGCTPTTCHHTDTFGTHDRLDEMYQWEDFMKANYGRNVEEIVWT